MLREETQRIADHLPNMMWIEVAGEDHGSYIEGSPVMGNLLIDFLRENNYRCSIKKRTSYNSS